MSLDVSTALALAAIIATMLGVLIIFSWMQERRDFYLAFWGAGYVVGGVATGLLCARGVIADFFSINIADALLALAYGLMLAALRDFCGRSTSIVWICAGAMLWLFACDFPFFLNSPPLRVALLSAVLAAYSAACAAQLWKGREERLASRLPAIACLSIHTFACAARVPLALMGGLDASHLVGGPWFTVLVLESLIIVIALAILVVSMAKERQRLEERIAAWTDELTGVASRRAFLTEGETRLAAARKAGATASTVLFDLDHFKGFNDNYGHETGDRVLRAFAECATQILRPDDLFGRIGGEEFAALLIGVGGESAQAVAERLRRAVEGIQLSKDGARLRVSVSAGVSTALTSERHLTDMLRQADRALYRAKSQGRNRVERNEPFAGLAA
jgi:diguanylate cyclase (GGDEF)-like protein